MSGRDSVAQEGEDGVCNSLQDNTGGWGGGWDSLVREYGGPEQGWGSHLEHPRARYCGRGCSRRESPVRKNLGRGGSGSNSLQDNTGGWDPLVREYGPISDGWGCPARGPERGGRYSRRGGCSRRGGRGRGRERGSSVWLADLQSMARKARENLERGGSGSPARENWGWGGSVPEISGWGGSGSPAREDEGRRSESLEREDGEESEMSGSECPRSENDDTPLSPENEEEKSAGRNRTEQIQSLQSSLKSAFDDMQADLVRAERDNKELTETNKKLKEELKRAKEGEESSKQNLEQTRNKLQKLVERTKILEEKQVELLKRIKVQEESSEKLEEELKRAEKGEESSKRDFEQTRNKLRELCTTFAAVKEECDKVCDQQGAAPQVAKKRKYVLKVLEVNDLLNCSICLEPWAQSGEHTVCSLSCGHFFGKSCITQWILKDESRGSSTCPACARRVTLSDIRHHYVSQIYEA